MHPFAHSILTHLRARGFDLSLAFSVQAYNAAVPATFHLPTYSHTTSSTLGILVANSKLLWPHFCTYLRTHPTFLDTTPNNPFDAFVTGQVDECIRLARRECNVPEAVQHDVRHYWEMAPGRMVAIQRLCHVAGLAYLDSGCHLNVHAEVGPWLALRSAIVIDLPGPSSLPAPLANPIPDVLQPHIHHALLQLLPPGSSYHMRPVPAAADSAPPRPPSREGLSTDMLAAISAFDRVMADDPGARNWCGWVALRRVAASWMGSARSKAVEYAPEAIEYHYTKETHVLRDIVGQGEQQMMEETGEKGIEN